MMKVTAFVKTTAPPKNGLVRRVIMARKKDVMITANYNNGATNFLKAFNNNLLYINPLL